MNKEKKIELVCGENKQTIIYIWLFTVGTGGFFGDFYSDILVIEVCCRINLIFINASL